MRPAARRRLSIVSSSLAVGLSLLVVSGPAAAQTVDPPSLAFEINWLQPRVVQEDDQTVVAQAAFFPIPVDLSGAVRATPEAVPLANAYEREWALSMIAAGTAGAVAGLHDMGAFGSGQGARTATLVTSGVLLGAGVVLITQAVRHRDAALRTHNRVPAE